MVRYGWPSVYILALRPENTPPPFGVNPLPHFLWDVIGCWNGDQRIWPYRLPTWLRGRMTVKWYPGTSTLRQPSGQLCLDLDWHLLLWIRAHGYGIVTIFITWASGRDINKSNATHLCFFSKKNPMIRHQCSSRVQCVSASYYTLGISIQWIIVT